MDSKSGPRPLARLRARRERSKRERGERREKKIAAQYGPGRTGRGDQWMGPGGT
jgi:hypothetical protein